MSTEVFLPKMFSPAIMKLVFPLLEFRELAVCMSVNKQWREVAQQDKFWKHLCGKRWPSICMQTSLPNLSYLKVYKSFHNPQPNKTLPPPNLSFHDLEFFIDIWAEETLVLSQVVPGPVMQKGSWVPPAGISEPLRHHMENRDYTLTFPVQERFNLPFNGNTWVSVLAGRKDSNKVACVIKKTIFVHIDEYMCRSVASEYLKFAPAYPFAATVRTLVYILFMGLQYREQITDVFAIELDFSGFAVTEVQILWLLDMLDWK